MSRNAVTHSPSITASDVLGVGAPASGSLLSCLGSIIAMVGFFLPWASCAGYRLSGYDLAAQNVPADVSEPSAGFLYLIPSLSLIALGIAISSVPLSIWKRVSRLIVAAAAALLALVVAPACLAALVFFLRFQSARNDPEAFGLGGLFQLEYGFWFTVIGLVLGLSGALVSLGSSIIHELVGARATKPMRTEGPDPPRSLPPQSGIPPA